LFGATDCHHENIIASADHPQFVDIETLFRPLLMPPANSNADAVAALQAIDSVLSTGLLPNPRNVNQSVADLSGMGARSYQETPLEAFQICKDDSGRARVAHDFYRMGRAFNRPRLNGKEVEPLLFVRDIREGFQDAYCLMSRSRYGLASVGGLLLKFRDAEVRVLLRSTAFYASLLRESRHPTALYDGGARDQILGHLWRDANAQPELSRVRESEFQQLRQGDIPFFRASPGCANVYADRSSSPVLTATESGFAAAEARLARMGAKDLAFQLDLITRSLKSLPETRRKKMPSPQDRGGAPLDLARAIGDGLFEKAIWGHGEATWLVPRSSVDPPCALLGEGPVKIIATDLYEGLCGVIFFLTYLARATGDTRFEALAQAAAQNLWRRLEEGELHDQPGAFNGLAGAVYTLSHLGAVSGKPSWIDRARKLGAQGALPQKTKPNLDLISGLSGMLLSVLALHEVAQDDETEASLNSLADRLLVEIRKSDANLPHQRGASHGWSGAAWALAAAQARSNEIHDKLSDVLRFDLQLTSNGDWTDPGDELHFGQATWCHGPAGIALCRTAAVKLGIKGQALGARAALNACLERREPRELGLCHGVAGVLDAVLVGAETFPEISQYNLRAKTLTKSFHQSVASMLEQPWEMPEVGLMIGISGVGLQLLRVADSRTPSVLLLDPPRRVGQT
jgi:type 2 lantibiotic biosynthesis protein LanM